MPMNLTARQSSVVALLAQRPCLKSDELGSLLNELPPKVRSALEIILGKVMVNDQNYTAEQKLAGELWEWAHGTRANKCKNGEIFLKVRVRNSPSMAPRYVGVLIESITVNTEKLFHPIVYWSRKDETTPSMTFHTEQGAVNTILTIETNAWERQFGSKPDWELPLTSGKLQTA